jgi:hypothetical protein
LIPVKLASEVRDDLRQLPNERLRKIAFHWLRRLEREPKLGKRLDWRPHRDLSNCRKVYFDEADEPLTYNFQAPRRRPEGPRFRIVYQLQPRDDRPHRVYVWAVGAKQDGVYDDAAKRQQE